MFDVLPVLHSRQPRYPELYYTDSARAELMSTVAQLLLLQEDAFYLSYIEAQPYSVYRDQSKQIRARRLYQNGGSPYDDLLHCLQPCSPKWTQIVQTLI